MPLVINSNKMSSNMITIKTRPNHQSRKRLSLVICVLVFLISLAVFLKKMAPTIFLGDSGELTTAAVVMGVPHPPGSPLFCLIGKSFSFMPLGSQAFRINLLSAFFGSLTLAIVFLLLVELRLNHFNAFLMSLFFGSGLTFINITAATEVYSLQLFITSLLLYVLLKNTARSMFTALFLCFLGVGAHITSIFTLPAILFFWPAGQRRRRQAQKYFITSAMLGLVIFLYLPLRAVNKPLFNWGNTVNLNNFINHVSNKKDAHLLAQIKPETILVNAKNFFAYLSDTFTSGGVFLLIIGIYLSLKNNFRTGILLIALIIPCFFLYLPLPRLPRAHLYAPVFLGLLLLFSAVFDEQNKFYGSKYLKPLVITCLIVLNLWRFSPQASERNNYAVYDHVSSFLKSAAPCYYLITSGDITQYGILYLKTIESLRPDVSYKLNMPDLYRLYPTMEANSDRNRKLSILAQRPLQFTWKGLTPYRTDIPLKSNGVLYVLNPAPPDLKLSSFSYRGYSKISPQKDFWYQYLLINRRQNQAAYYSGRKKFAKAAALLNEALDVGYDTGVSLDLAKIYLATNDLTKANAIINELYRKRPQLSTVVSLKK